MRRKKTVQPGKSTKIALFFGLLILFLILSALSIKIVLMISKSKFDGKHQMLIQTSSQGVQEIIAYNPDTKTIVTLQEPKDGDSIRFLTDATVPGFFDRSAKKLTEDLLMHMTSVRNLTPFDIVNLFIFAHGVSDTNSTMQNLVFPLTPSKIAITNKLFTDQTIYQEGKSVGISNGADTPGIGNNASVMLSRIGVNVISVTTSDQVQNMSSIMYTGQETYTVRRLSSLLGIPSEQTKNQQVADIIVVIGKDKVGLFQ